MHWSLRSGVKFSTGEKSGDDVPTRWEKLEQRRRFQVKPKMKRFKLWTAFTVPLGIGLMGLAEITSVPPGKFKIPPPPLFTNSILPGTNELPHLKMKTLDDFSTLPPGVYLTKPYTCMVKVPDSVHDDIAVRRVTVPTNSMPVLRPKLKAVPLGHPGG